MTSEAVKGIYLVASITVVGKASEDAYTGDSTVANGARSMAILPDGEIPIVDATYEIPNWLLSV